jgi:diguanylate cyclase (GGDEF)-like protein/PAS domain S-box-containing protein
LRTDNIVEIERLRAELEQTKRVFNAAFHATLIGKALVDPAGICVEVNASLAEMLGYTPNELAGVHFKDFTHPGDVDADLELFDAVMRGEHDSYQLEKRYVRKDGTTLHVILSVTVARDGNGMPMCFISEILDMTQYRRISEDLHEANVKLQEMVVTDHLTGLYNKRGFEEALSVPIAGDETSVLLIDVDNFKAINDSLGHEAGDLVLAEIGKRLPRVVRAHDVVARLGGDEFGVIMHATGRTFAERAAERIVTQLRFNMISGEPTAIGVSVGVACSGAGPTTLRRLTAQADRALYAAKRAGRGQWSACDDSAKMDS